jgi:hypothetical protein
VAGEVVFRGTLGPENSAAVELPAQVLQALGTSQKRPPVRVTVNGVELRTTIAVYGGKSYIGLRREMRETMRVAPGKPFEIHMVIDTERLGSRGDRTSSRG